MSKLSRASGKVCPSTAALIAELEMHSNDSNLQRHLERCGICRAAIEGLAAESSWWHEATETLATRPPELGHVTASICPLSLQQDLPAQCDPLCEHEIARLKQMLQTPSHPDLIARIGRYELEQLIGRGGMGLVFRARDTELQRIVAVKTLSMILMPQATARERFVREGRAAAMLTHPHIVPMYDVITEPPVPALVMQYIAGPTLDEWVQKHGTMPWPDALIIAGQLADALTAAHAEGLVHRDIKPSNVLMEADGTRALLTDFGLVRTMDEATLTHTGILAGTPHFMSPEQARGEEVDGRSDLFSLGSLLYFLMTGQPPFRGRESMAVLHAVCNSQHVPLWRFRRDIPREFSQLVDQLLCKQPRQRPASSQALRDSIRSLQAAPRRLNRIATPLSRRACGWLFMLMVSVVAAASAGITRDHWLIRLFDDQPISTQAVMASAHDPGDSINATQLDSHNPKIDSGETSPVMFRNDVSHPNGAAMKPIHATLDDGEWTSLAQRGIAIQEDIAQFRKHSLFPGDPSSSIDQPRTGQAFQATSQAAMEIELRIDYQRKNLSSALDSVPR